MYLMHLSIEIDVPYPCPILLHVCHVLFWLLSGFFVYKTEQFIQLMQSLRVCILIYHYAPFPQAKKSPSHSGKGLKM